MKHVNIPTAVEARHATDGSVHPQRFTWQGDWLSISDVGRQWMDEAGRHVLVMVSGRHTYELLLERGELLWHVVRAPERGVLA
jgi:hypothetical protein